MTDRWERVVTQALKGNEIWWDTNQFASRNDNKNRTLFVAFVVSISFDTGGLKLLALTLQK